MFLFDLHCDTLTEANNCGRGLMNDKLRVSFGRLPSDWQWCQCFAVYVPDKLRGEAAAAYFDQNVRLFRAQHKLHMSRMQAVRTTNEIETAIAAGRCAAMLTVESGAALAGDVKNVRKLAMAGVKMLTLTWNGENELAGGADTDVGFSFFGRMVTAVLEQNAIILDVSHLSDRAFDELAQFAKRPFVASHSNSRAVCDHRRNLTDEQFNKIKENGGLVGLNAYPEFIAGEQDASFEQFAAHIDHFIELGGGDILALGLDLDGADIMPSWLQGIQDVPALYEKMCARFGQEQTDKIFGLNAMTFFRRYEAIDLLFETLRGDE